MTRTLRAGTFLAPSIRPFYEHVSAELGRALGIEITVEDGTDLDDDYDLAFICGLPYVERAARLEALAAPVLRGARFRGRPVYFSDVIVRRGSELGSFAELRGRSWAVNEPSSQSGYGVTRARLARDGETYGFFGAVIEAGSHARAIAMVAAGEVDAAAIDCQVLAVALRSDASLPDQIEVIDSLGPSTIQPLAAARRLPSALRADLRAAAAALEPAPVFEDCGVERLVAVEDSDYDDIRSMLAASRAAGFLTLR